MTSSDAFCCAFDSIEIDPARAPSPAAIEAAMAMCAPPDRPGFYLLDDAGGRFVVDPEFGFISLKDDAIFEAERGQVRTARLKVVEHSGACYELTLRLRISGRVPQMVADAEENARHGLEEPQICASVHWGAYKGFAGERASPLLGRDDARYGDLIPFPTPHDLDAACELCLGAVAPPAAAANALWSL
jgi:hypothetical protein